jgi:hypothetical protein
VSPSSRARSGSTARTTSSRGPGGSADPRHQRRSAGRGQDRLRCRGPPWRRCGRAPSRTPTCGPSKCGRRAGVFGGAGPGAAWMRARVALVEGEEPSAFQRAVIVADSGTGVSQGVDYRRWLAINVELTLSVHRDPAASGSTSTSTPRWVPRGPAAQIPSSATARAGSGGPSRRCWWHPVPEPRSATSTASGNRTFPETGRITGAGNARLPEVCAFVCQVSAPSSPEWRRRGGAETTEAWRPMSAPATPAM